MNEKTDLLKSELRVVNIGIKEFMNSLKKQGVKVIHVNWKPPAGGDKDILKILGDLL